MTDAILDVRGLTRRFGALTAVGDLSFSLERGCVSGFIGPNGSGKTTTMRILATLDLPDEGDASIDGMSILVEPRAVRRRVGFMSDSFTPYPNLTVAEFLDFTARANGLRGRARIETIRAVSGFCGLDEFKTRPSTGLSKGMGQRLHLAKTLIHDPMLLILDEPTAGLDPRARIEFRDLLAELAADGKAILISSHILTELAESCDSVLVIERGKRIASGTIADLAKGVEAHRRIRARAAGDLETLAAFFLLQPLVRDAMVDAGSVRFAFEGADDELAGLLARAVGAGHRIHAFHAESADLEDIFLHTTKGKLQ